MANFSAMRYLHTVRCCLPCSFSAKKKIMEQVRHHIDHYLIENPSANYHNLIERFGEPQIIASSYVDEMESSDILNSMRIKRSIVKIISGAAVLALVVWMLYAVASFAYVADQSDGTIETYIELSEQ